MPPRNSYSFSYPFPSAETTRRTKELRRPSRRDGETARRLRRAVSAVVSEAREPASGGSGGQTRKQRSAMSVRSFRSQGESDGQSRDGNFRSAEPSTEGNKGQTIRRAKELSVSVGCPGERRREARRRQTSSGLLGAGKNKKKTLSLPITGHTRLRCRQTETATKTFHLQNLPPKGIRGQTIRRTEYRGQRRAEAERRQGDCAGQSPRSSRSKGGSGTGSDTKTNNSDNTDTEGKPRRTSLLHCNKH